jgi:hypothetical protein
VQCGKVREQNVMGIRGVGRRLKGGAKRGDAGVWWIPVFLGLPFLPEGSVNASERSAPTQKAEAAMLKYSAVLPGIKFDAARHANPQP